MCGISGLVLKPGVSVEEADLRSMASEMARRGPDSEGVALLGSVGLAHRRLRILDLSAAADQPLFNEDGKVAVVFNGEIYNFGELRVELERLGHRFRTRSDTEVIVHAYEEWGEAAYRRLNGIFAFALWDGRGPAPTVTLVRDRFGAKPLFYAIHDGRLAFASELKPILRVPWISKDVDAQALFLFLKFSHVPSPLSILRGVGQLEAGTCLRFAAGQAVKRGFWDSLELARGGGEGGAPASDARLLDEFERVLVRCVERQMVSDVPLGCFLSGGIDSSLLAWASSRALGHRLRTFSIGYEEAEFDELPHARAVAAALGTEHHELKVGPKDFFDLIPDVPLYFDQPFADPTLLSSLLLSRFARGSVTVALSGDGGDEIFFGYPYQRALLWAGSVAHVPAALRGGGLGLFERAFFWMSGMSAVPGPWARGRKLAAIFQFRDEAELLQYFIGTIGPLRLDDLASLLRDPPAAGPAFFSRMVGSFEGLSWRERIEQTFLKTFLTDTVLAKTDRAGMAFGLEARVPFLDDEMVAFSARLPFRLKASWGAQKVLPRRLAARHFSTEVAGRGKQGFGIPLREWLRGELKYLLDEYLGETRLAREGIFERKRVKTLVREHLSGGANHSHLLWSLVSFQMWKERYF